MSNLDAARTALKAAIRKFSYRENHDEPFTLASGKKSPYYFDLKQTLLNPPYLALAGRLIAQMITENYPNQVIAAGLTMGADPIIYAACLAHGGAGVGGAHEVLFADDQAHGGAGVGGAHEVLFADDQAHGGAGVGGAHEVLFADDQAHGSARVGGAHEVLFADDQAHGGAGVGGAHEVLFADDQAHGSAMAKIFPAIVRKQAKDHGTGKRIEMLKGIPNSLPCVMVDDVITTAGSTLKAALVMREAGFSIRHAFCILDRQEGGREALAEHGITLISVFTAAEFKGK